jgi:hypothetical protein
MIDSTPRKRRGSGWPLVAGIATMAAAVIAVVVGLSLLGGQDDVGVEPSPSAMVSPSPSVSAPASPTASGGVSPSASPEPTQPPGQPSTGWSRAATFGEPGTLTLVSDVATWSGGFVAVGSRWPTEALVSPAEPMVWTSADGRQWSEGSKLVDATDIQLTSVATLLDGRVMVTGDVGKEAAATDGDAPLPSTGVWVSSDGRHWEPLDAPFGDDELMAVGAGPVGYVAAGGREVWFSTDGTAWELVHQVADGEVVRNPVAGDEGFVASGDDSNGGSFMLASGDGIEWFEARGTQIIDIAPIGGDWLGTMLVPETINLMRSGNGLDWSTVLDVNTLTGPDGPKAGRGLSNDAIHRAPISSVDGFQVMSFAWNHCCAQPDMGTMVVASTDGQEWMQIDLGEAPRVVAAAADDAVIVLVGQANRGTEGAIWVRDR